MSDDALPICKLVDKKADFDRQRAAKRKTKEKGATASPGAGGTKEIQLTWGVSSNDLSHKLSKARSQLLKGSRVAIVITTKKGGPKAVAGGEQARVRGEMLEQIEKTMCEEDDGGRKGRRFNEVDWQRGGSAAVITFEPVLPSKDKASK